MHDEIPAPPTPNDPIDGSSANDDGDRDGVDPPEEAESDRAEGGRAESDRAGGGRAEPDRAESDDDCDPESVEYRIERLRLLRIAVTLAVVVARLIRSL